MLASVTHIVATGQHGQVYEVWSDGQMIGTTITDDAGTVRTWAWSASPFELRAVGDAADVIEIQIPTVDNTVTIPAKPTRKTMKPHGCGAGAHLPLIGLLFLRRRGHRDRAEPCDDLVNAS